MWSTLRMQSLLVLLLACLLPIEGWTAGQARDTSHMTFALHVLDAFDSNLLDQSSTSKPINVYSQTLRQSATGQLFALSRCDSSYCLLENMFGEIPGVMGNRVSQTSKPFCRGILGSVQPELVDVHGNPITSNVLGQTTAAIAYYFNIGLISILFILVAYQVFFDAMLSPSLDGDISDRNFTIYKVIRIVSGLSLVAPYFESGYSLLQSMLMYIILLGVGFGDQVLTQGLLQSGLLNHQNSVHTQMAGTQSDVSPCQTSNVAVGAYNYGWIHAGYLYPTLLSGLSTEPGQFKMPDFISIIYRLFGVVNDAPAADQSTEAVTLDASMVTQVANIIQSKNCLTAQMLFEGQKTSTCVKTRLNGRTLDTLSADQLVDIVNACANLTITFSGDAGKQSAVLSFNDNRAKPSNQSCGSLRFPAEFINQTNVSSLTSNTQTVTFSALRQYLSAGATAWFTATIDIADQLFGHFYNNGNVCAAQSALNEQEKQLCNRFGLFPNTCPSGGNCSPLMVLQDGHAITSGYGYNQYLLNGTRSVSGGVDETLHRNDFILYRDLVAKAPLRQFEGVLSVSSDALQAGIQPSCVNTGASNLSSLICQAKNLPTSGGGQSTSAAITRPDDGLITGDYLFNQSPPQRTELNAAIAIRMVRYALLPQEEARADGRFVPTLYSQAVQFVQAVIAPARTTSASIRVASHLDGATAFLLRSIYPEQAFSFLPSVDENMRTASQWLSLGVESPDPPSARNMNTVMHMVLSRVLGAYYYPSNNEVTTRNFHNPPARSQVCVDTFQKRCELRSHAGCFQAMKQAGCIRNGQGLLAAAEIAQSFIEGSGRAIPYYSPFADFVGMGAEILRATSLFLSVNTRQLQDQMFNAQLQSMTAQVVQFGLQMGSNMLLGEFQSKRRIVAGMVGMMIAQSVGEWSQFLIDYLRNAVIFYSNIATTFVIVLFPIGMLMAIMIPFYPVLVFIMGVIGWLISVLEAMISAPIIAVGLAHPDGHDFFGRSASAVLLTLSTALRPVLMVLGVFFSVMVLQYLFLLFHIGMVENIYFLTSGAYGTVALNDPQLMLFLIVGILVLYVFTGWELVSQICMMTVALGARILTYLGGQEEDLRAIQSAVSTTRQQASQIGDAVGGSAQGVGEKFAQTSTTTLQAVPAVVKAAFVSSPGTPSAWSALTSRKFQFSEDFDTSEFRGQTRMYNSNVAKQAYKEEALERLRKSKYSFDPRGFRKKWLEKEIENLKKGDGAWRVRGLIRAGYSALGGDKFAERLLPRLSQSDKLYLQEKSREQQQKLFESAKNTKAAWVRSFGDNVNDAVKEYEKKLEQDDPHKDSKLTAFRDFYDGYVAAETRDSTELQNLKSEIAKGLDRKGLSRFLTDLGGKLPDTSNNRVPTIVNPYVWGQYLLYGGIHLLRSAVPIVFKNPDEELLMDASAAQLKAYASLHGITSQDVLGKIEELERKESAYITQKELPDVDRNKTLDENIDINRQKIIDQLGAGNDREKFIKKRVDTLEQYSRSARSRHDGRGSAIPLQTDRV